MDKFFGAPCNVVSFTASCALVSVRGFAVLARFRGDSGYFKKTCRAIQSLLWPLKAFGLGFCVLSDLSGMSDEVTVQSFPV
jgi:hypothetical protein